jgi:hypothetical protein
VRLQQNKQRIILGRWISVFSCGLVAAVVWLIIEPWMSEPIAEYIQSWQPLHVIFALLVLLVPLIFAFANGRWPAFLGVNKYFFTYPPLWVSVVTAFSFLEIWSLSIGDGGYFSPIVADAGSVLFIILAAIPIVGILIFVIIQMTCSRYDNKTPKSPPVPETLDEFEKLRTWIIDDTEIEQPINDRFNHKSIAQRIAGRITESSHEEPPTMALVGPLGSGKSSIGRLVQWYLQEYPSIRVVTVSLWPFDSQEAAVRGVLKALIHEVGKHVNTLPLSGLPEDYMSAIEHAGGRRYGSLIRMFRTEWRPEIILDRLAEVALATDLRFVLWIEDLERFAGFSNIADNQVVDLHETVRLGAIRSLFFMLDRKPRISVIVADTSLETRFDVEKIARFIEHPPRLQPEIVLSDLYTLRQACLHGWPKPIIDIVEPTDRQAVLPLTDESLFFSEIFSDYNGVPSVIGAIVIVCRTPRIYKSFIRQAESIWQKLAGEIDFDDVLVVSLIRIAHPQLFSFIDKHIDIFRSGFVKPRNGAGDDNEQHPVFHEYTNIWKSETDYQYGESLDVLVKFLFPSLNRNTIGDHQRVQGVRNIGYWERYLSVPDIIESESDQVALRCIQGWQNKESSELISWVVDEVRHVQIEKFTGCFDEDELCLLLEQVIEAESKELWPANNRYGALPRNGIISIWRMVDARQPSEDDLIDVIIKSVNKYTAVNLPLVEDLQHYFGTESNDVPHRLNAENRQLLVSEVHKALISNFVPDRYEDLLIATRGGSYYVIYHLAWGLDRIRSNRTGQLPFEKWSDFSRVLLTSAEHAPDKAIPLIIPFIIDYDYRRSTATFNEEAARRLFEFDRLMPLLINMEINSDFESELVDRLKAAKEFAKAQ